MIGHPLPTPSGTVLPKKTGRGQQRIFPQLTWSLQSHHCCLQNRKRKLFELKDVAAGDVIAAVMVVAADVAVEAAINGLTDRDWSVSSNRSV